MSGAGEPEEHGDGAGRTGARRGRRSPLVLAAVAAGALAVAGGGAYLAAGAGGATDGAGPPPRIGPAMTPMDDGGPGSVSAAPGGPGSPSAPGIAPGEPDPRGAGYRVTVPLPEGPDTATVYTVRDDITAGRAATLAKALGVPGTPHTSGLFWQVGSAADGTGPVLRVQKKAPGTWTFSRYAMAQGGDGCAKGRPCPGGAPSSPGGVVGPAVGAVSEAAAKKAAAPVLAAAGLRGAHLEAGRLLGAVRVVEADPVVDGLPTYGWTTGLQVGADGRITGGGGQLGVPEAGTAYPVAGAAEALKALGAGASGGTGCATRTPLTGPVTGAEPAPTGSCAPSGRARPLPVDAVVFGLAARPVGGVPGLVPSWLFTVDPGGGAPAYRVAQPALHSGASRAPLPSLPPHGMKPGGGSGADTAADQPLSYSTHGRTLTVRFWGGVCGTYGVRADESDAAVAVRVEKPAAKPGGTCVASAKRLSRSLTLDRPLGTRTVLSAATGAEVPAGSR
ncbi:hypothetical protein AB0910_25860 [Streptomyces sp. NPDC047002]|uniref:hypothetical protein n=1 Tax=Streptomyces sp. NPDC047002 TaxID=3155475 RepID=UPI003453F5B8